MYAKKDGDRFWLYFDTVEGAKALFKEEEKHLWEYHAFCGWTGTRLLEFSGPADRYRRQITDEFEVRESFEEGDPVCWCGANGEVIRTRVDFVGCTFDGRSYGFNPDGRYLSSHKTPSLFHGHDVLRLEDQKFPVTRKEREEAELTKLKEFERVVRPVIKFLNDNYHPHVQAVITPTSAELAEGVLSTGQIPDYVKD